ncbi:aldehyde dehydrogenase family protein [Pedobacter frigiditerrae]|uniref:Aldehyde dehydrogenase n=1 Tax=Pedobacter frigiditerrae TaxID=2530452 RepID=A0A4R0N5D8_9SPHI|nr:aldehyde dehydrogenase family protein [Pedobacter frigiditerrae]TCC93822.1 aldehyde dehydrogenase family protein [Pedobacter frigiditerrae]
MEQKINQVFKSQQAYKYTLRKENAAQRILRLKALKNAILKNESEIYQALQSDLRKSRFEAALTELIFIYGELDFAIKKLSGWMRPKHIAATLSNPFAKNRLYYEPKGVCLIIAPWNYPFQLTMSPLISAIAAGNCCIVKPSELSPQTSKIVSKIIEEAFNEQEVACFEGNADISSALLELPFDHIFFTGSTAIGKVVMEAAAKNLTSVTLELGGKSPTIIDKDVNLEKAAEKIAWGKLVNSGQTCIAPDYIFVHEQQHDEFIRLYKAAASRMFFKTETKIDHRVYGKIISQKHFVRLKTLVDEAVEKGARIDWGGNFDEQEQTIYPVILSKIPNGAKIMEEEIFGPILPIITYQNIAEVIDQINAKSKPLALYIFSKSSKMVKDVIKNTSAGGTCVNDVLIHISNPKLPFGGVNGSGIGSSHGFFGFKNFSHERAIMFQRRLDFNRMIYPPYVGKEWALKMLKKII